MFAASRRRPSWQRSWVSRAMMTVSRRLIGPQAGLFEVGNQAAADICIGDHASEFAIRVGPPSRPQGDQTVGDLPRAGDVAVSNSDRRANRQTVRVLLAGGEFSLLCRRREISFRVIGDKEAEMLPRGANYSFIRNPGKQKIQAAVDLA